ncbi:MAG: hypothetical protein ACOX19_01035 [Fermentimonas sp.]
MMRGLTQLQDSLESHNIKDGEQINVVDYASVDNWNNGMHVCTWIPTKPT